MKKSKILVKSIALVLFLSLFSTSTPAQAYKKTGWKFSSPKEISYILMPNAKSYNISTYLNKWKNCGGRTIGFKDYTNDTSKKNPSIIFSTSTVANGTYGVTRYIKDNYFTITFYKSFLTTSSERRNETIVHEVGHALGLAHPTVVTDPTKAVMRATGFNFKAYPLSDDIAGIKSIY